VKPRLKLKARGKPYDRRLEEGLHLGYRRLKGAGKWVARLYGGGQEYTVQTLELADDFSDANGATVLSFDQALKRARERRDGSGRTRTVHRRRCAVAARRGIGSAALTTFRRRGGRRTTPACSLSVKLAAAPWQMA